MQGLFKGVHRNFLVSYQLNTPAMVLSTNLGFPRMGSNRQLKKLVEDFWASRVSEGELLQGAKDLRAKHWELQKNAGLQHVPSNDFSLYDHVLDTSVLFGVVPARYQGLTGLDLYFAMGKCGPVRG
jgi:5-methyltetrahydropteroyltriglutamate--homocysteine methyltransferase